MKQEETYFEQFVKESIEGYRMYPSTKTWQQINKKINNNLKPTLIAITVLALLTLFTFDNNKNSIANNDNLNFGNLNQQFDASNNNIAIETANENTNANTNIALTANKNTINSITNLSNTNISNNSTASTATAKVSAKAYTKTNVNAIENKLENKSYLVANSTELTTTNEGAVIEDKALKNEIVQLVNTPNVNIAVYTEDNTESIDEELTTTSVNKQTKEKKNQTVVKQTNDEKLAVPNNALITKENKKSIVQIYVTPGLSYRQLYDKRNDVNNIPFAAQSNNNGDLNASVFHKPATAIEFGVAWVKPVTNALEFKTAVQVNYNSYKIKTAEAQSQVATIALTGNNTQVNRVTNLVNADGANPKWIENTQLQISMPIGLNFLIANNKRIKLGVGSSIQPALTVYNKTLLLSTDLKNYATAPYLIRKIHINGAIEPFVAFKGKNLQWQFGPQLRYQFMSTYAKTYPFKENMFDYGFKIGVGKKF